MQRKPLVSAGVAVAIAILIAIATFTPTLEYDPRLATAPAGMSTRSPVETVEEFLRRSGRLPRPGTGLVQRAATLEWEVTPESAVWITDIVVKRVRLTSGAPLLMSVLDDDPTFGAEVDVMVITSDGQKTPLRVELWDYGLLTPWALHWRGDGWKPVQVRWNQNR